MTTLFEYRETTITQGKWAAGAINGEPFDRDDIFEAIDAFKRDYAPAADKYNGIRKALISRLRGGTAADTAALDGDLTDLGKRVSTLKASAQSLEKVLREYARRRDPQLLGHEYAVPPVPIAVTVGDAALKLVDRFIEAWNAEEARRQALRNKVADDLGSPDYAVPSFDDLLKAQRDGAKSVKP